MTCRLLLIPALVLSVSLYSQSAFYIQNGSNLTKVEDGNPVQINAKEWQVRLYRKGASTTGTSFWGIIKGSSANEVMETLKKQQQFELDFNNFIGKGRVEDEVYTHFNPLGPIAVTDVPKAGDLPFTDAQKKVADLYDKAIETYFDGKEINQSLKAILPETEENRYGEIGNNFTEYSLNIKDAVQQIMILQNLLVSHTNASLQNINTRIKEITNKLNVSQVKLNKVKTTLNTVANVQNENKQINGALPSFKNIVVTLPERYKNSVQTVLEATDNQLTNLKQSVPVELTAGMNQEQKIYFKKFVEDINNYGNGMALCFGYLSPGAYGYGYLNNNKIKIDETDQYYRDNVLRNAQIFETSNYNIYYSGALLEKGNAAYDLFKLLDSDPNSGKVLKNKILQYGITNVNMIYQQAIDGYQDASVVKDKQALLLKLKQNLK